jgi:hypothetical protein
MRTLVGKIRIWRRYDLGTVLELANYSLKFWRPSNYDDEETTVSNSTITKNDTADEKFGWKELSTLVCGEVVRYFVEIAPLFSQCLLLIAALIILKSAKKFTSKLECDLENNQHFWRLLEDYYSLKDMSVSLNKIIGSILIAFGINSFSTLPESFVKKIIGASILGDLQIILLLLYFLKICVDIGQKVAFSYINI